ncbi:MAG: caspase family protein [Paracoccaceae bacterium]
MAIERILAVALAGLLLAAPAAARDWAIVVGIDDYIHFEPFDPDRPGGGHFDLQGATNDAKVIAAALRKVGVDLPDNRLLLDHAATVAAFEAAWREVTTQAVAGDRVFVTFAGHGGQEREVSEPFDEVDGLDETLMFADFDPANPRIGRLTDDQLYVMLQSVPHLQVVWVMDSCHSGGLERSVNPRAGGLTRSGGIWDIPIDPLPTELPGGQGESGAPDLPHVTQILATATDDRLVQETAFDGVPHGALSWFFAKAIEGEADMNGDGVITRLEMAAYVGDRVFTHMDQNQQPRFLPRGDPSVMLNLQGEVPPPPAPVPPGLPVRVVGAPPPGLEGGQCPGCRLVDVGHAVMFEQVQGGWAVYNGQGDRVTVITGDARAQIERARFLLDLNEAKEPTLPPVVLRPHQSAARQPIGATVGFDFPPPALDLNFLTLFNVTSDGTVQYGLYPPSFREDAPADAGLQLRFSVSPPTGEDQLVVIWCRRPPLSLHALLRAVNGGPVPPMSEVQAASADTDCQFGRIGLFTEG